jgi:cyanate lyase
VLGTGTALSNPEIALHVTRLMAQLETDLGAAQATLAELRGGIAEAPETQVRNVAEKIDLFEIDEALALLNDLKTQLVGPT